MASRAKVHKDYLKQLSDSGFEPDQRVEVRESADADDWLKARIRKTDNLTEAQLDSLLDRGSVRLKVRKTKVVNGKTEDYVVK
jgi:hypothetical protein